MKTGQNIRLCKRAKRIEQLYSKPWSRFHNPSKWLRKYRNSQRKVEID